MKKQKKLKPRLPIETVLKLRKCATLKDKRKEANKKACRNSKFHLTSL